MSLTVDRKSSINHSAGHWKALATAFRLDPTSHAVEVAAANLAASVAQDRARGMPFSTVAILRRDDAPAYYPLCEILDGFGLRVMKLRREDKHLWVRATLREDS